MFSLFRPKRQDPAVKAMLTEFQSDTRPFGAWVEEQIPTLTTAVSQGYLQRVPGGYAITDHGKAYRAGHSS